VNDRCREELELLRKNWPELDFREEGLWVRIPRYQVPGDLWDRDEVEIALQLPPDLPGQQPYGFYVRPPLTLKERGPIGSYKVPVATPFEPDWGMFSWQLVEWHSRDDILSGTNMVNFVISFADRLRQGA
jgi:hypothetical protein